ncbi:MAG: hypothetical protein GMKNLPBB_02106 [Myxococcota bacterium]|nr:hypothetical protein [Myxococcota bacterium]
MMEAASHGGDHDGLPMRPGLRQAPNAMKEPVRTIRIHGLTGNGIEAACLRFAEELGGGETMRIQAAPVPRGGKLTVTLRAALPEAFPDEVDFSGSEGRESHGGRRAVRVDARAALLELRKASLPAWEDFFCGCLWSLAGWKVPDAASPAFVLGMEAAGKPAAPARPRANQRRLPRLPLLTLADCIHCGECDLACPDFCFQWRIEEKGGRLVQFLTAINYDSCKGCLRCVEICEPGALTAADEWSLSGEVLLAGVRPG